MIVDYLGYPQYDKLTPIECLQAWEIMAMRKWLKLQDCDELRKYERDLMCMNLSPRGSGDGGRG